MTKKLGIEKEKRQIKIPFATIRRGIRRNRIMMVLRIGKIKGHFRRPSLPRVHSPRSPHKTTLLPTYRPISGRLLHIPKDSSHRPPPKIFPWNWLQLWFRIQLRGTLRLSFGECVGNESKIYFTKVQRTFDFTRL